MEHNRSQKELSWIDGYFARIKYIIPIFIISIVGNIVLTTFLRWLLSVHFHVFSFDSEVWGPWFLMSGPTIAGVFWLRQRLSVLVFEEYQDKRKFAILMIQGITMFATSLATQLFIDTYTAKIQTVNSVSDINKGEKTRYYYVRHLIPLIDSICIYTNTYVTNSRDADFVVYVYYTVPIKDSVDGNKKYWLCINYDTSIGNFESKRYKDSIYSTFKRVSAARQENYDYSRIDHIDTDVLANNREVCIKTIQTRFTINDDKDIVFLSPVFDSYNKRNGNKLPWIFALFGIGVGLLLFILLFPRYKPPMSKIIKH